MARNGCDGGQFNQGIVNYAVAFLLAGAMALVSLYLRAREVRFEEDKCVSRDDAVVPLDTTLTLYFILLLPY